MKTDEDKARSLYTKDELGYVEKEKERFFGITYQPMQLIQPERVKNSSPIRETSIGRLSHHHPGYFPGFSLYRVSIIPPRGYIIWGLLDWAKMVCVCVLSMQWTEVC
jgi:hypothetical protein